MSTTGPYITVVIDASNEHVKFSGIARAIHVQDCLYFLFPRLKTSWSRPITKPVSLLDGLFTLQWICWAPFWHRPSAGTRTHFQHWDRHVPKLAPCQYGTSQFWNWDQSVFAIHPVLALGPQFQNWAPSAGIGCNTQNSKSAHIPFWHHAKMRCPHVGTGTSKRVSIV